MESNAVFSQGDFYKVSFLFFNRVTILCCYIQMPAKFRFMGTYGNSDSQY